MDELNKILLKTKEASKKLSIASTEKKNQALEFIAKHLKMHSRAIIEANQKDLENGKQKGLSNAMLNRLELTEEKIDQICHDVIQVKNLPDPIGEIIEKNVRPNGLIIEKVRIPFGVICCIYESRPNVSVDIASLSLKTGNACVLRGGSEAIHTNRILTSLMQEAIQDILPPEAITFISEKSHDVVLDLIQKKEYIDLVIPRGGKGLIQYVLKHATVPIIETGAGTCHVYVEKSADFSMALEIIYNAKVSKPSVCNAMECLLVDEAIASEFLPLVMEKLGSVPVLLKGDSQVKEIINCSLIEDQDYFLEYNDYILNIKIVSNLDEAINHINHYGTHHSDAIVTNNEEAKSKFLHQVDSACVYVNASTRFTDGGEFGFGAELGISTQKLHARGPMGLKEMTSYQYRIYGKGQVRI